MSSICVLADAYALQEQSFWATGDNLTNVTNIQFLLAVIMINKDLIERCLMIRKISTRRIFHYFQWHTRRLDSMMLDLSSFLIQLYGNQQITIGDFILIWV